MWEVVFHNSAIYQWIRSRHVTLVVCEPVLFNDPSGLIDGIFICDVHWCHQNAWYQFQRIQWNNKSIAMHNIFSTNFFSNSWLLLAPLWFPKDRASLGSDILSLGSSFFPWATMIPPSKYFPFCTSLDGAWKGASKTPTGLNYEP